MNNGNTRREFDPADGMEVTDVLPTETGLYLEQVRRATQAHLRRMMAKISNFGIGGEEFEEMEEIFGAKHPYREASCRRRDPMHPHDGWFWKY